MAPAREIEPFRPPRAAGGSEARSRRVSNTEGGRVQPSPSSLGGLGGSNAKFWGNLPTVGGFAVVNPDGMGRQLRRFSYGYPGQIDDLARMPQIIARALPWLRIDRKRIYALGSSMGGQETLLLVARHPRLLAGAVAMDSVTDLTRRYEQNAQNPRRRRPSGRPETRGRRHAEAAPHRVHGAQLALESFGLLTGPPAHWPRSVHVLAAVSL